MLSWFGCLAMWPAIQLLPPQHLPSVQLGGHSVLCDRTSTSVACASCCADTAATSQHRFPLMAAGALVAKSPIPCGTVVGWLVCAGVSHTCRTSILSKCRDANSRCSEQGSNKGVSRRDLLQPSAQVHSYRMPNSTGNKQPQQHW